MPTLYTYYVTDLLEGAIFGTDSDEEAKNLATSEEYFVMDSSTGEWLLADGTRQNIDRLGRSRE
jgi:hypothetical protein